MVFFYGFMATEKLILPYFIGIVSHTVGLIYLFKFILREGEVNEQVLKDMFTQNEAVFSKKASSKKTFTSLSVKVIMEDPDAVIAIYKKAQKIKGLITL